MATFNDKIILMLTEVIPIPGGHFGCYQWQRKSNMSDALQHNLNTGNHQDVAIIFQLSIYIYCPYIYCPYIYILSLYIYIYIDATLIITYIHIQSIVMYSFIFSQDCWWWKLNFCGMILATSTTIRAGWYCHVLLLVQVLTSIELRNAPISNA